MLQRFGNLHRRRGFAGARRTGQQHDGAVFAVIRNPVCRGVHQRGVVGVRLFDQADRVGHGTVVEILQLVCHAFFSFQAQ